MGMLTQSPNSAFPWLRKVNSIVGLNGDSALGDDNNESSVEEGADH